MGHSLIDHNFTLPRAILMTLISLPATPELFPLEPPAVTDRVTLTAISHNVSTLRDDYNIPARLEQKCSTYEGSGNKTLHKKYPDCARRRSWRRFHCLYGVLLRKVDMPIHGGDPMFTPCASFCRPLPGCRSG